MKIRLLISSLVACGLTASSVVHALPFNDDMVDNQKRTGSIMRPKVPGTVPISAGDDEPLTRDDAQKLQNPMPGDVTSATRGERLFRVNCFPCHGDISKDPYEPGPVSANSNGVIRGVDISRMGISGPIANVSDGYIYGTIHFGSFTTIMPAIGYKLSPKEHWDIVNYVRKISKEKEKH